MASPNLAISPNPTFGFPYNNSSAGINSAVSPPRSPTPTGGRLSSSFPKPLNKPTVPPQQQQLQQPSPILQPSQQKQGIEQISIPSSLEKKPEHQSLFQSINPILGYLS
eukprot:Awhi_evm1s2868